MSSESFKCSLHDVSVHIICMMRFLYLQKHKTFNVAVEKKKDRKRKVFLYFSATTCLATFNRNLEWSCID